MSQHAAARKAMELEVPCLKECLSDRLAIRTMGFIALSLGDWRRLRCLFDIGALNENDFTFTAKNTYITRLLGLCLASNQQGGDRNKSAGN